MSADYEQDPPPAYQATSPNSPLHVNRALYSAIASASAAPGTRRLAQRITIAPRTAEAWSVPARSVCRISTPEGPQVGDLNVWNAHSPREHMWTARSRQLHSSHLRKFDRLWSRLPYMRPMATVVANTLEEGPLDGCGGRVHDLLGTRCDPYINKILTGKSYDHHCHSNLTRAILPFGMTEMDVHDNVNLFQHTGLNSDDKYYIRPCPAVANDAIEFFAEIDLIFAISACPAGDESDFGWGAMAATCRPLQVEVFELVDEDELLKDWTAPAVADYDGLHGLKSPAAAQEG